MTSKLVILSSLLGLLLFGCNKESDEKSSSHLSISGGNSKSVSSSSDDFSDLEKKEEDESCDTTEDLEKKIEEKAKKQEAFKLQGGDPGCTTD